MNVLFDKNAIFGSAHVASVNPRAAAIVAERPRGRRTRGVRSRCVGVQRRRKCSTTEISARNGKKDSIIHNELCAGQEWVVCQAMVRLERTGRIQKVRSVTDRLCAYLGQESYR